MATRSRGRFSYFWVRICPNKGEIVIVRESSGVRHIKRRTSYRATPRNIDRLKDVLWKRLRAPLYWTAYTPGDPEYAELFANY